GLALSMALTSPRSVGAGYFRNHSYVLLGLQALVAAVAWLRADQLPWQLPVLGAACSYVAAVGWLYEKPRLGRIALTAVAAISLCGSRTTLPSMAISTILRTAWLLDPPTGGLVLGVTMAAMLLGHWYLNAPEMKLAPLQRLVQGMAAVVVLRAIAAGAGLGLL